MSAKVLFVDDDESNLIVCRESCGSEFPVLTADGADRLVRLQPVGQALAQEEPDDLARPRAQLLTDDDAARQPVAQGEGAVDRAVVGDADDVDVRRPQRVLELVGRGGGVARPHRVQVEVDPYVT